MSGYDAEAATDVRYDPETMTYRARHDWSGDTSLSTTLVNTVSLVTDTRPGRLQPLGDAIDVDALDELFAEPDDPRGSISFTWQGFPVTVRAGGEVVIDASNDMRGSESS